MKTITNCNMKWSGTVVINAKLCQCVGSDGAFPTSQQIKYKGPDYLKEHCQVGYQNKYIIWELTNDIEEGQLNLQELKAINST